MSYRVLWEPPRKQTQMSVCGNYGIRPSLGGATHRYDLFRLGVAIGGFDSMKAAREHARKHALGKVTEKTCTAGGSEHHGSGQEDSTHPIEMGDSDSRSASQSSSSSRSRRTGRRRARRSG